MRLGRLAFVALLLLGCEPEIDPLAAAEAAFRAGDYPAAATDFARALEVASAAERPGVRARLGQTQKLLGRTDAAEQTLQRAIAEADGRGDGEVAARARRYLGRLYADAGRAGEAEALYAAAHAWYQAHGPADELVKVQVNRAGLAWAAQSFDRAWELYQDVYQRAVALEDARLQANGLDGMAMLLSYVGEFEAARELLTQTARMHELAGRPADAAVAYATQGIVAVSEGDAAEARRLATLALEHGQATGMQAAVIQARIVLAAAALEVQDWDAALAEADAAVAGADAHKIEPLRQEAEAAALEALAGARRWSAFAARADAFKPGTAELRARVQTLRAWRAQARGDAAAARRHFQAAVDEFDRLRALLGLEHLSTSLTRTRRAAYDGLIGLLADAGEGDAALRVVGAVKARAFAERLHATREAEPGGPAAPVAGSDSPLPSRRTVERASNLFRLAEPAAPADPATIRATLPPDAAVIEYYSLPDRLLVFWLTAAGVEVQSAPVAASALDEEVERLLLGIRSKGNDYVPAAGRLGRWLLDPIAARLAAARDVRLLVIVPHGPLHPVPFEALPWAGRLLVDRFAVVTEANLTAVATALRPAPAAGPAHMLAVGDPRDNLPGAREEAQEVARRFTGTETLLGAEARESVVRDALGRADLVHFATHGIRARPDAPLYLELVPDSGFDGRLHADELAASPTSARLVVLSVCDSAGGQGGAGDEIPWVVDRAFLEAGARSVVASRWPVHDAASVLFMRNFYAGLEGGDLIDAFHRAQLALRNGRAKPEELGPLLAMLDTARGTQAPTRRRIRDFTHPYFWATFSLRGAWTLPQNP